MKKYAAFFPALGALLIVSFIGYIGYFAYFDYMQNHLRRHQDIGRYERFLSYSLGEFEIITAGEIRSAGGDPNWKEWMEWEIQFTRQNGKERNFLFTDQNPFGWSVLNHAMSMAREDIQREVASQYFSIEELTDGSGRMLSNSTWGNVVSPGAGTVVSVFGSHPNTRQLVSCPQFYDRVLNARNGLRLYSVTPQELVSDWGFIFQVVVQTDDFENYADLIERFKAMTRTLATYLEQDQIQISFRFDPPGMSFGGIYNRQTDTFETMIDCMMCPIVYISCIDMMMKSHLAGRM